MRYYFHIQFRMLNRRLTEAGIPPVVGYAVGAVLFVGLSIYLFQKQEFAEYAYAALALLLLPRLSERSRNYFLKSCFSGGGYRRLRVLENVLVVFPFLLFLLGYGHWLQALALLVVAAVFALLRLDMQLNLSIPTPFFRRPFEFAVGFRKTYLLILAAYFLTYMAIVVNNFNLGVFALAVVFFTCFSYYGKPEGKYYVWIFSMSPQRFLFQKIWTGLLYATLLTLPVWIALGIFFSENLHLLLVFQLLGYIYLPAVILAKYAVYPYEMGILQGVLLALGVVFPPLMLGIIPFFFKQSVRRLNDILA